MIEIIKNIEGVINIKDFVIFKNGIKIYDEIISFSENSYPSLENDKKVMDAHNNIIKHLEKYVGTISEDNEGEDNSKPSVDPIWDEARRIIA